MDSRLERIEWQAHEIETKLANISQDITEAYDVLRNAIALLEWGSDEDKLEEAVKDVMQLLETDAMNVLEMIEGTVESAALDASDLGDMLEDIDMEQ